MNEDLPPHMKLKKVLNYDEFSTGAVRCELPTITANPTGLDFPEPKFNFLTTYLG
jgi:hypothetical protein